MAGFTMQEQSAIFPFVCTMSFGQACILWDMVSIRTGLARVPVITPMGEPNTPLAFRRRDACHSKQQAGHEKMTVLSRQNTKDYISRIANYDTSILLIVPQKNISRLYVVSGAKTHQRYPIAT